MRSLSLCCVDSTVLIYECTHSTGIDPISSYFIPIPNVARRGLGRLGASCLNMPRAPCTRRRPPPFPPQPAADWATSYLAPHLLSAQFGIPSSAISGGGVSGPLAAGYGYATGSPDSPRQTESPRGDNSGTLNSGSLISCSPGVSIGSKIGRTITQLVRRGSVNNSVPNSPSFQGTLGSAGRLQQPRVLDHLLPAIAAGESEPPSLLLSSPVAASARASLDSPGQHQDHRDIRRSKMALEQLASGTAVSGCTRDARRALSLPATLLLGQRDQHERIRSELHGDKGDRAFLVS